MHHRRREKKEEKMRIKTFIISMMVLFLGTGLSLLGQTSAQVTVNANIQAVSELILDGTDPGGKNPTNYSTAETCNFGQVDAIGTAISGGDALVNTITGIPVDVSGADLSGGDGIYDPDCVGSFYPFFVTDIPAPDQNNHVASALGIHVKSVGSGSGGGYSLDVAAVKTAGDPLVTVGQLKWKDNATTGGSGYTDYTDFGASDNIIGGSGNYVGSLYHDYGLLVEFLDPTGINTWLVTYTLTRT
jgi:hypothetical protein